MKKIFTAKQIEHSVDELCQWVLQTAGEEDRLAVVGIRTRGDTLANRIVQRLRAAGKGRSIEHGVLDITFYRDDLSQRAGMPLVRATEIDFDMDGAWVLLVDDVLHTGRSARAALDALHDFGRPKVVRLAVLVDRGGREMPIAADFAAKRMDVAADQLVQVRLKENDGHEDVSIIPGA